MTEVAPGIRRLLAPNPSMMTGPGTNTYLVGVAEVAVVDPGPALEAHVEAIVAAAGAPITAIWLTHAHPDHGRAVAGLKARTGARLLAWGAPNRTYDLRDLPPPDHSLLDLEVFTHDGRNYTALHTPGHASDHLCFFRADDGVLFSGDVVVGAGTVVIAPPDGNLTQYLDTLAVLRDLGASSILPGHGDVIADPAGKLTEYITHRLARERQVLEGLEAGARTVQALVEGIYPDRRVHHVAAQQVLGHLQKLEREGRVVADGERWRLQG